ncbi:MAG: hypothetical protein IJ880_14885 [Bacilli bacterium]|nr:hypothetical protein [Bacilli bacterium]
MSTSVTRKTVHYTIPDPPSSEELVDRSWYKTVIDIMLTNLNELDSFDTHNANMEKKKTDNTIPATKQLNGITDKETKLALETARTNILSPDTPLYAKDVNTIANSLNKIYARAKSGSHASTVSKDEVVKVSKLETFISTCIEVSQSLDPKADAIWSDDGNCNVGCELKCETKCMGVCQVGCMVSCMASCEVSCMTSCMTACMTSCMVSCMTTCMVSCQNCHGGTCHNQHCGGGF